MPSMHSRPTAVVADERPLGRSLVRFLLLEHGYDVLEETSMPFDTVLAAAHHHPDVIVAHEACVDPNFRYGVDRIRGASPESRIIVVVDDGSIVDPSLAAAADFVVEDGPGLPQLVLALDGTALGLRPTVMSLAAEEASRSAVARRRGRWFERLQGATAASILVIALVLSRGAEPPVAQDPRDGPSFRDRNLVVAYDSLLELADRAPSAGADDVVAMAVQLLEERAAAEAQGLDVSALDSRIADLIGPLLPTLPPRTADALVAVLGDLVDEVDPGPQGPKIGRAHV